MKLLLIFVVAWMQLTGCQSHTNSNQQADSENQSEPGDSAADCTYRKTIRKPATTFPFSVADKIDVVSFKDDTGAVVKMTNGRFIIDNLQERVHLNPSQVDSLFSILYDYGFQTPGSEFLVVSKACYSPRHAILFYRQTKAVAFVELCFQCGNHRVSKPEVFGEFCQQKLWMIQRFMEKTGLRYRLHTW